MATTSQVKRTPSGRIKYRGMSFAGYNKPKRTPDAAKKSAVLAKKGSTIKLVRFGDQNMKIKKAVLATENRLGPGTNATVPTTSFQHGIGHAKPGSMIDTVRLLSDLWPLAFGLGSMIFILSRLWTDVESLKEQVRTLFSFHNNQKRDKDE